jgi:hypothetical protein
LNAVLFRLFSVFRLFDELELVEPGKENNHHDDDNAVEGIPP